MLGNVISSPSDLRDVGVRELLNPTSVAVVGASRKVNSIGGAILANLLRDGYTGRIYPINPQTSEVQGLRAYSSVTAVGQPIDLAVIAVPKSAVESVVDDCISTGVRGLVIISAGFAEASEEGRQTERRILHKVRAAGIRMVGPNCMGLLNTDPRVRLNVTFTPVWPPAGNIAILTQSGALGLTILDQVKRLNLGISSFVSVGNKADVSGNDLLSYWMDDPRTGVVLLYLESFGNPRKFARIAPEIVRRKPVVAVKAGRSAAGSRAASSHSAALANLDVAVDALFEQAGVIRTQTLEEMFDVAALLATQPVPRGPRVGVVSNAGGPAILLADACEARGLVLPSLSEKSLAAFREFLPPHAGLSNPIDLVASDDPATIERSIRILGDDPNIDAIVVIFIPPLMTTRPEDVAAAIARAAGELPGEKPIQTVFLSTQGTPEMLGSGPRGRLPAYSYPENAAIALSAAYRYGTWKNRPRGNIEVLPPPVITEVRRIVCKEAVAAGGPSWLSPEGVSQVLKAIDLKMAEAREVSLEEAAVEADRMGYPLVMKAVAPGLVHKSDVGGVVLGLKTASDARQAAGHMKQRLTSAGYELQRVLLQRQIGDGVEMLIGVTTDPVFGPLLVCGMGGIHVELLKDVSFRLTPVSDRDAAEMIAKLKSAPLLEGYRGTPPADREALIGAILKVSALVQAVPELMELDLNPVKVLPPGQGVIAVDGRMRIRPPMDR